MWLLCHGNMSFHTRFVLFSFVRALTTFGLFHCLLDLVDAFPNLRNRKAHDKNIHKP